MNLDRHTILLIGIAVAVLLFVASYRQRIVPAATDTSGLDNLNDTAPAAYLGYNWAMPSFMRPMMPQASQGGSQSPLPRWADSMCGGCQ